MIKISKGPQRADEFMTELRANPEWVAQQAARDRLSAEREREYARMEAPAVKALNEAGILVASVWDLVNSPGPYADAIPVLLAELQKDHPRKVREGLARALAVKDARPLWPRLVELFEKDPDGAMTNGPKWGLALALKVNADKACIDDLVRLVQNRAHGENRAPLINALGKLGRDGRVLAALEDVAQDEPVARDANKAIKAVQKRMAAKAPKGHA